MSLAGSAVRMYLFYAFGVLLLLGATAVVGTVIPGPAALVVGFVVLLVAVLVGLFWHGRLRG